MMTFNVAGEGILDLACAEIMLAAFGKGVAASYDKRGKHRLDEKIGAYVNASRFGTPWLILRDFDFDEMCALSLHHRLVPNPPADARYILRFPVRSVESWLMADADQLSRYLSIRRGLLPASPDECDRPKAILVQAAANSRRREIREGIPPSDEYVSVGPEYNLWLDDYVRSYWRPSVAAEQSPSLRRAMSALRVFTGVEATR